MEKLKKYALLLLVLVSSSKGFCQTDSYIDEGLIATRLTLSLSTMFSNHQSYFYMHGALEYYVSPKISVAGEGYFYLGNSTKEESEFKYNHNLFFGASKHFTLKNNDFFIGIQPGVSITKLNPVKYNLTETHTGINPLASTVLGYNYYVSKYFHFFVQSRVILGENNTDVHRSLSEFRFSAGLGLNLDVKK